MYGIKKYTALILSLLILLSVVPIDITVFADTEISIVSAKASTEYRSYTVECGYDNDNNTRWQATPPDNAPYYLVDLGEAKTFNKISMVSVFPASVLGFKIEAADDEAMTQNVVTIESGSSQTTNNIYSFAPVTKRYIKYSVTQKNGYIAILEFDVVMSNPAEIIMLDDYAEAVIPENGSVTVKLPEFALKDDSGAVMASDSANAEYTIPQTRGVSISGNTVTVTSEAKEQEIEVSIKVSASPDIYQKTLLKIVNEKSPKSDRNYKILTAGATSAHGSYPASNIIDDNEATRWQSLSKDATPMVSFDLGKAQKFNKITIQYINPQNITKYVIEAADNPYMTEGLVTVYEGRAEKNLESISFAEVEKRYIRYRTESLSVNSMGMYCFYVQYAAPSMLEVFDAPEYANLPKKGEIVELDIPDVLVKDNDGGILNCGYNINYQTEAQGVVINGNKIVLTDEAAAQDLKIVASLKDFPEIMTEIIIPLYPYGVIPGETYKELKFQSAISSTSHGSYPANYTIDGVLTTRWQPLSFDLLPNLTYDFGVETKFNKIVFYPTAVAAVKGYVIEAADNKEMTENRVLLSEGTDITSPAVFTFETVKRRYIKYSIPNFEGVPGVLEFKAFYSVPEKVEFKESLDNIALPAKGEGEKEVALPNVYVTDIEGHEVNDANYMVEYSVSGLSDVRIENDKLIITENTPEGEFSITASVNGREDISVSALVSTFRKENLLSSKNVKNGSGENLGVLTDDNYLTGIELGESDVFIINNEDGESFNKFVLKVENFENISYIDIKCAETEDFSDAVDVCISNAFTDNIIKFVTEEVSGKFIKISVGTSGTARLSEIEAFSVYPHRIKADVSEKTVYIPTFDDEIKNEPAVGVYVLDKYGDEVHSENGGVIWTAPYGLTQGVTLDENTGNLTIEPIASYTSFVLRVTSLAMETLYADIKINLKEPLATEGETDNIAKEKEAWASGNHASFPAKNAVDGNVQTRLQIAGAYPQRFMVDLGEAQKFNSVTINFLNSLNIKNPTLRAANDKESLNDESSIIATIAYPMKKVATVSLPETEARYIMLHITEASSGCSIIEFEVRNLSHAVITATMPYSVTVPENGSVTTEIPTVDIKDKNGGDIVFAEEDYRFEAISMPEGVTLNSDGSLMVEAFAKDSIAKIKILSTQDETVYNIYEIKFISEVKEEVDTSEDKLKEIADRFDIEEYVSSSVAKEDFNLPLIFEDADVYYEVIKGETSLEIDDSGNASVLREKNDVYAKIRATFSLLNKIEVREFEIKIPAKSSGGSSGGGGSSSGGGKGGNLILDSMKTNIDIDKMQSIKEFADIGEVPWAEPYLRKLADMGILNGSDGKLRPKDYIKREEFVKIISEAFLKNEETASNAEFDDLDKNAWYYQYISKCVSKGIIYGFSENIFGIGNEITREDAVTIISRVLKTDSTEEHYLSYVDADEISDYAKEAVKKLSKLGIISGTDDNKFMPKAKITRAETAKIIALLMEEK